MNSTAIRRIAAPSIVALTLGLSLAACGDNASDAGDTGASLTDLAGKLAGAGASTQEKAQEAWAIGFQGQTDGAVTVTYDPIGSGDGRKQFIAGGTLFAGSDAYLTDDEGQLSAAKERCGGEDPIEIPAYISPIAIAFNVDGVDALNLDAKTIAKIFNGKISNWNDAAIAAQNPDAALPDLAITPVHRADESGTTENFTEYLSSAGEGAWGYDPSGDWPAPGGEAAEGTSGVVSAVTKGQGSIGYADESQVGDLAVVSVKVGDGYSAPTSEGSAKVVAVSPALEGRPAVDMAVELDRSTTEAGAYPLVLVSYLIACQHYDDANDAALVKGYLTYVISPDGQAAAQANAGSAPIDAEFASKALAIVDAIAAK